MRRKFPWVEVQKSSLFVPRQTSKGGKNRKKNENGRRLEILHRVRVIDEDCTYKTRKHFGNFFRIHGPWRSSVVVIEGWQSIENFAQRMWRSQEEIWESKRIWGRDWQIASFEARLNLYLSRTCSFYYTLLFGQFGKILKYITEMSGLVEKKWQHNFY